MCYGMLQGFSGQAQSSSGHSVCDSCQVSSRDYSYSSMLLSLCFCMPLLFSASCALHPSVTSPCFTRGGGRKPSSYQGLPKCLIFLMCCALKISLFLRESVIQWYNRTIKSACLTVAVFKKGSTEVLWMVLDFQEVYTWSIFCYRVLH